MVREGTRVDRNARTEGDEEVVPSLVNPSTRHLLSRHLASHSGWFGQARRDGNSQQATGFPTSREEKYLSKGLKKPNESGLSPVHDRQCRGGRRHICWVTAPSSFASGWRRRGRLPRCRWLSVQLLGQPNVSRPTTGPRKSERSAAKGVLGPPQD